jgi:TonB family protein
MKIRIPLIMVSFLFASVCFGQTVTSTNDANITSEIVSSSSKICFNTKKKPKLKLSKHWTKVNGKKVLISDCCPLQATAIEKPQIEYPQAARAVKAEGTVSVRVFVNEKGKVFWAEVENGHPLLRDIALKSACKTVFKPYICCQKKAEHFQTIISYNFILE